MSLRPIDMQTMVPKIPEIAKTNRLDPQRMALAQQQLQEQNQKNNTIAQQKVIKSNENEQAKNNDDAKNKGKNQYTKRGKQDNESSDGKAELHEKEHRIDIRI